MLSLLSDALADRAAIGPIHKAMANTSNLAATCQERKMGKADRTLRSDPPSALKNQRRGATDVPQALFER
jgi:hypothetical protein